MQRRELVLLLPLGTQVRGPIKNIQGNTKHVLFDIHYCRYACDIDIVSRFWPMRGF